MWSGPFNFYQFSESGITGSGIVAAYKGNVSGFFTPSGMFGTPRGHLNLLGEHIADPTLVPVYSVIVSGDLGTSHPNQFTSSFKLSGSFYPLNTGTASMSSSFTGAVESGHFDTPTIYTLITGAWTTGDGDKPTYSVRPTGKIVPLGLDVPNISLYVSGEMLSGLGDASTYSVSIEGNIVKYERDIVSFVAELSHIEFKAFGGQISGGITGTTSLSIDFATIIYSRHGA